MKQTGIGAVLAVDGNDLSASTAGISSISSSLNPLDMTAINQTAMARAAGHKDGAIDVEAFFDPATEHDILRTVTGADLYVAFGVGTSLGAPTASMVAKKVEVAPARQADGSLRSPFKTLGADAGLEWGHQLTTGFDAFTGAAATSSYDNKAASTGGAMVVHVNGFTGTSVTIDLQESSDDGAGDAWADVDASVTLVFSADGAQRVEIGAAIGVERYVRANLTGTFSAANILISFVPGVFV